MGIPKWKEAVLQEMHALKKNETWEVMELPQGKGQGQSNHTMFLRQFEDGTKTILIPHVYTGNGKTKKESCH